MTDRMKAAAAVLVGVLVGVPGFAQNRSYRDGVYTEVQARRGEQIYTAQCANCHRPDLSGAEVAPALVGFAFDGNWNGLPLSELFDRVRRTMPPQAPNTLTRQQTADLLAFLLERGRAPAGLAELPGDVSVLSQIDYRAAN